MGHRVGPRTVSGLLKKLGYSLQANKKTTEVVKCAGINECKGHGACSGADNSCKSKNECKGKGWTETASAKECADKNGKVLSEKI